MPLDHIEIKFSRQSKKERGRLEAKRRAAWRSVWGRRGEALREVSRAVEEKEGRIVKIEELQHLLKCKI